MEEKIRAAVFIDLNNVEESIREYRESGMFLDYTRLVDVLTEGMELVSAKAYDAVPRNNPDLTALHGTLESAGFELVLKVPAPVENNMGRTCVQEEVDLRGQIRQGDHRLRRQGHAPGRRVHREDREDRRVRGLLRCDVLRAEGEGGDPVHRRPVRLAGHGLHQEARLHQRRPGLHHEGGRCG